MQEHNLLHEHDGSPNLNRQQGPESPAGQVATHPCHQPEIRGYTMLYNVLLCYTAPLSDNSNHCFWLQVGAFHVHSNYNIL